MKPATASALRLSFLALILVLPADAVGQSAEGIEFFEKKIRPLLIDQCHKCHAGDKVKGSLRLDSGEAIRKGGDNGTAIVAGDPDKSLLIKAVRYQDELRMPPRSKLSDQQIADLTAWVKMGAPWPASFEKKAGIAEAFNLLERKSKHWCWQPIKAENPPAGGGDWVRSPIDAFIQAKLQASGLKPAPAADRRTLIRRVYFDLIGLPPTPAQLDAALNDPAANWFEKLVEQLLDSPHYGERWARHWLDLMRFAETYGHEFDFEIPSAYQYRDYVIRAFNADLPYDKLLTEHLAGDLLQNPRQHPTEKYNESILGTGFWFLHEAKHSPVDLRIDESDRLDNQIDVFSKAFLGLTVSCARCHDHKFDAISTKDYYALMGYLESSRFQHAFIDLDPERQEQLRELERLQNQVRKGTTTALAKSLETRVASLAKHLLANRRILPAAQPEEIKARAKWVQAWARSGSSRPDHFFYPWNVLDNFNNEDTFAAVRKNILSTMKTQTGRSADIEQKAVVLADFGKQSFRDWSVSGEAWGKAPTLGPTPAPHLEAKPDPNHKGWLPHGVAHSGLISPKLQGVLRSKTFVIPKGKLLFHVAGKGAQVNLVIDNLQLIRDPIYGGLTFKIEHGDLMQWRVMDVSMWVGHKAYIEIIDDGPGYAAVSKILAADDTAQPLPAPNYLILQMLDDIDLTSAEQLAERYQDLVQKTLQRWRQGELTRDDSDRLELLSQIVTNEALPLLPGQDVPPPDGLAELQEKQRELEKNLPAPRRALAMIDGTAWNERVYIRGNPKTLGDEVPRRLLEALGGLERPAPKQGSGRLELARQLVDPANPLTARVMVNRLWKHHFGEGLVRSVDNFGVLGEAPSHPELLDYLATQFVQKGWSIKQMHKLLVLSNTYQMASKPGDAKAEETDPQNKLLHRMPIRRLEAEAIRDSLLTISGRLDPKLYGPGVMPHLTPHMSGRGRPGVSGPLDGNGRRSIYINVRRNFLTPMFLAFDYPIPFTTIGKRTSSNVPAQALILMNNPLVAEQAQLWAKRSLAEGKLSPQERIEKLYVQAFARPPLEGELKEGLTFVQEQGKLYGNPDDLRLWTDFCHVLFNVKEFIFIN